MFNITIKQMRYIEAAGRLGSIANAAEELAISQSSISAAIDILEKQLNYDLFIRAPAKGISATPSGHLAIQTIRAFLDQWGHFGTELEAIGGNASGKLRIACFVTAAGAFMPPMLRQFQAEFPNVEIELHEENMEGVADLLDEGKVDLAFTYSDVVAPSHAFEALIDVPPFALVARDSDLAKQDDVSLAELATLPMVLLDLNRTRGYYSRFLTDAGHQVRVAHRTESVEMVRTLVANGFGFSILNARPSEYIAGKSGYRVMPIRERLKTRSFGILLRAGMRHPMIVRRFVTMCQDLKEQGMFKGLVVK